jgi:sensor histidine kinase YesM
MKIADLVNPKKLTSHFLFAAIALGAVLFVALTSDGPFPFSSALGFFSLGFLQLEIFILIAGKIFKDLPTGMPRKEFTRYLLLRLVLFLIACFIAALILYIIYLSVFAAATGGNINSVIDDFRTNQFSGWFESTMKGLAFGAVIFVYIQWQDALQREQKLIEENLVFQNETLRNQVNPHFLFNNLNTLASLISADPGLAEKFTVKLSSIYRYILENGSKKSIPLQSEIDFICDYFELYRIRDGEKIRLEIAIEAAGRYEIIPVSLQILVENAIKHNSATRENPLVISMSLEGKSVVVRNNLQPMTTGQASTGIGLKNLSQRIRLSAGADITINETVTEFIVKVPLL